MLSKGGTSSGSQGLKLLHVTLPRLTPSEQLDACDALIDLVITEIVSHMTLENVVDEMFCNPAPYVPFPLLLATSLTTKIAQLGLSVGGWKSFGQTAAIVISGPRCRRCSRRLPLGKVQRISLRSRRVSMHFPVDSVCIFGAVLRSRPLTVVSTEWPCLSGKATESVGSVFHTLLLQTSTVGLCPGGKASVTVSKWIQRQVVSRDRPDNASITHGAGRRGKVREYPPSTGYGRAIRYIVARRCVMSAVSIYCNSTRCGPGGVGRRCSPSDPRGGQ